MSGWGDPVGAPEREAFSPSNYVNCTVGILPRELMRDQPSSYGGTKDAVRADVIVIYDPTGQNRAGEEFGGIRIFNPGIVDRIKDYVGRPVIGRIITSPGQNPGNPAIVLSPPTPEELAYAQQYLAGRTPPAATPPPQAPPFQASAPAPAPSSPPPPPSQTFGGGAPSTFGSPPPPSPVTPDTPPF